MPTPLMLQLEQDPFCVLAGIFLGLLMPRLRPSQKINTIVGLASYGVPRGESNATLGL
jgi:hypothetical protein